MNKYFKYALLLLIVSVLGTLCSVVIHESVIVCDIFIIVLILFFNNFTEEKEKIHKFSNRNIKKVVGWRPISEYDDTYDWVLVRMYDENLPCIPIVAEKRSDGKWHAILSDRELPFEVREFFDMEQLDKKEVL